MSIGRRAIAENLRGVPVVLSALLVLAGVSACAQGSSSAAASGGPVTSSTSSAVSVSTASQSTAARSDSSKPASLKRSPQQTAVRAPSRAAAKKKAPATARAPSAPRPPIVWSPIPFPALRKAQMAAYSRANYGIDSYMLSDPEVIVEHYTGGPTYESAWNTFAADVPDSELHMLPGTCAHFIVGTDSTIHQLVSLKLMCRHTVGLNYTAFGIENVGMSDQEILTNARQLSASLALTRWLACKYHIAVRNVIGHNESLSSPYHRELIPALRTQTHSDWNRADMDVYREKLQALGACA